MKTLQSHLCLKRPNFQINPKQSLEDASLFFGEARNKKIIENVILGYLSGYVPRMYLLGNYGCGKTHLLYHLKHYFERDSSQIKIYPFVVGIEAESKTRYQLLHKRLLDAIGISLLEKAYMDYAFKLGNDREHGLRELFSDPNLYQTMQLIPTGPANKTLAWRWLIGERLTTADQQSLGVTTNLTDTGSLVDVLVTIGELFKRTDGHLLFMIDEAEALHSVSNEDSRRSWHDAFRKLSDANDNQSIGWIASFYSSAVNDAPSFMMEADITTRIGNEGIVTLEALIPVEVKKFLLDLIRCFIDQNCAAELIKKENLKTTPDLYPFTQDGLNQFIQHAGADQHNAIPRTILRAITGCALESLRSNCPVFDAQLVDRVVPQEFADQRT
ncbi:BREX system ATP-binding domain-containing protein [Chloroflexota bacterium]